MNILNKNYFSKYASITFWTRPCVELMKVVNGTSNSNEIIKKMKNPRVYTTRNDARSMWPQCMQVRFYVDIAPATKDQCDKEVRVPPPVCPRPQYHSDLQFPSFDHYRKDAYKNTKATTWGQGDAKVACGYAIGVFGLMACHYGLKAELIHFLSSMSAPADVLALASIEIELANIPEGSTASFKWRGKPLFIKHRTDKDMEVEAGTPMNALVDPATPDQRAPNPEWLVVIGICTHLGCVPIANSGDYSGGFYCPCHGSHYDNLGRIRKGPAPLNLEIPPYKFITDTLLLVG